MKSARLLSLGYILSTELTITKIVCLSDQGRIFCIANDNTTVYELEYRSESTAMIPRMRLVSFSYWLSHVPIMSHFTYYTHTLREMWSKHQYAPLKDIVIDERMELLFTLDVESTICAWKITRKGIKRSSFITYKYVEFADSEVLYPLEKLFVIDPDADNCSLVAFATNGDQFRYRYNSYMSTSQVELYFGTRIKSYVDPQRRVSNCFAADNCVILSHCVDADSSDSLLVATSPKCVLPPHNMARDVIASFKPAAMNRVERVVAMAKVNEQVRVSPNDLCSQVTVSPTRYMIAHRHALSVYLQIKPVDTLFLILSASSGRSRDSLIERFSSIYSPTDYAAMLLQIAIGRLHPYSNYNGNYSTEQSFTLENEVLGVPSLDSLGKSIFEESSGRAMDAARQLLRAASVPGSDANYMTTGDARQITVTLSPFTNGTLAYVARTLYPLWDLPLTRLEERSVLRARSNLQSLTSYLERMNINVDNGKMFLVNVPQQWFKEKVVVTLPRGAGLTKQELVRLDLLALFNGYLLAKKHWKRVNFFWSWATPLSRPRTRMCTLVRW
ncbi:hypothetical protein AGDE_07942 [Angomonas deanei]|nr:hypothetical protein AGDE_07942 [Angomonas deanei]|eukprot:EPY34386.1 hypothetical protein AGDE_07942 [Angomonas deanei]